MRASNPMRRPGRAPCRSTRPLFIFDSAEHAASLFNLQTSARLFAPLESDRGGVLEERVAALEGGRAGLAVASGMAAQMVALLTLCEAGDGIVAARTLYGGSYCSWMFPCANSN